MTRRSLSTYSDIFPVLDAAVEHQGLIVPFESKGAAVRWRQRAYQARYTMREVEAERMAGIPGYDPSTPYDLLYIEVEKDELEIWRAVITVREPPAVIRDLQGNPVVLTKKRVEESDLDARASAFAEKFK